MTVFDCPVVVYEKSRGCVKFVDAYLSPAPTVSAHCYAYAYASTGSGTIFLAMGNGRIVACGLR